MKNHYLLAFFLVFFAFSAQAQVKLGNQQQAADPSAALDIESNYQGFLAPRMDSVARKSIANPAQGLLVYDTSYQRFYVFAANAWNAILDAQSNAAAISASISSLNSSIQTQLSTKANASDLSLKANVTALNAKADTNRVNAVKSDLLTQIDAKANASALTGLASNQVVQDTAAAIRATLSTKANASALTSLASTQSVQDTAAAIRNTLNLKASKVALQDTALAIRNAISVQQTAINAKLPKSGPATFTGDLTIDGKQSVSGNMEVGGELLMSSSNVGSGDIPVSNGSPSLHNSSLQINNDIVSGSSYIIISPTVDYEGCRVFVSGKSSGYFVVSSVCDTSKLISFDYLIINKKTN